MTEIAVVGAGARTPLGLSAVQTGFFLRAGLFALGESPLADPSGEPIAMGFVPVLDARWIGPERLVALARPALSEALSPVRSMAVEAFVCIDPGMIREAEARAAIEGMVREELPSAKVTVVPQGETGAVSVLQEAIRTLELRQADAVVIGGVHSDHDPAVISALAARGRLFSRDNLDARIPGEAAAFFVIMRSVEAGGKGLSPLAEILGSGLAREDDSPDDEVKAATARALSAAVKQATEPLRESGGTAGWTWNDLCHEAARLREWQSAFIRAQKVLGRPYRLDSPAQRMGCLGAAALPLFVVTAATAWSRGYAPSPVALGTAGSDSGERAALLLGDPGVRDEVRR